MMTVISIYLLYIACFDADVRLESTVQELRKRGSSFRCRHWRSSGSCWDSICPLRSGICQSADVRLRSSPGPHMPVVVHAAYVSDSRLAADLVEAAVRLVQLLRPLERQAQTVGHQHSVHDVVGHDYDRLARVFRDQLIEDRSSAGQDITVTLTPR